MQAVYTRSLPHQPHSLPPQPPSCLKSHLIGLVWSHASISIHLLWPWLNLMGVKEVFTLAVCTLIVCLADLVNWKRRKWSQSVRLIGSTPPSTTPHCMHNPAPILSRFTLGYFVTLCLGQDFCVRRYICVCVCTCMRAWACLPCMREEKYAETEGEIRHEVGGGREVNEHWWNEGA